METFATLEPREGVIAPQTGPPIPVDSRISWRNRLDHLIARLGINRSGHRVAPGLYAIGSPDRKGPVLVTANYTLSFDALRQNLAGQSAYILVLDTRGVNVWCAAGKGTFGTDELVNRIKAVDLKNRIDAPRRLILPQLGGPGVAAHLVKKRSGFKVLYGPVRADDLPAYLEKGEATPAMRQVTFSFLDRLVLTPVEIKPVLLPMAVASVILYLAGGIPAALAVIVATMGGALFFPLFLPWLPTKNFVTKGLILGLLLALPFALYALAGAIAPIGLLPALVPLLAMPPVTAFLALNFTGATTFTSQTGVKREIFRYTRPLALLFTSGLILGLTLFVMEHI